MNLDRLCDMVSANLFSHAETVNYGSVHAELVIHNGRVVKVLYTTSTSLVNNYSVSVDPGNDE